MFNSAVTAAAIGVTSRQLDNFIRRHFSKLVPRGKQGRARTIPHSAVETAAVARMKLGWQILAAQYRDEGSFFLGDRPYVCDVYFANLSRWWKMRDWLREHEPRWHALMERVDAMPEVSPVFERHWS